MTRTYSLEAKARSARNTGYPWWVNMLLIESIIFVTVILGGYYLAISLDFIK